jgi:Protein of unknown function (DUF2798)
MLHARLAPIVFSLLLSGLMSLIVSGVSTYHSLGAGAAFFINWLEAWRTSWAVAFPVVMIVAPATKAMVNRIFDSTSESNDVARGG